MKTFEIPDGTVDRHYRTTGALDREDIRSILALREEASSAGDVAMVVNCNVALGVVHGDRDGAQRVCLATIAAVQLGER